MARTRRQTMEGWITDGPYLLAVGLIRLVRGLLVL